MPWAEASLYCMGSPLYMAKKWCVYLAAQNGRPPNLRSPLPPRSYHGMSPFVKNHSFAVYALVLLGSRI
jgi:hypothetical protein